MQLKNVFYLPSGRIFLNEMGDGNAEFLDSGDYNIYYMPDNSIRTDFMMEGTKIETS